MRFGWIFILASSVWAQEACQKHYQAQLPQGVTFRIPARQTLAIEQRPNDAALSQVIWGRGLLTIAQGRTEEREFVCFLDGKGKATGVYLKPAPPALPRFAKR